MSTARCPKCGNFITVGILEGFEEQGIKFFDNETIQFIQTSEGFDRYKLTYGIKFHECGSQKRDRCKYWEQCRAYPENCNGCSNWVSWNEPPDPIDL